MKLENYEVHLPSYSIGDRIYDKIGDKIDAVHIVLGKAEAAVDNNNVLAVFHGGHVLTDLIESPEGNDL